MIGEERSPLSPDSSLIIATGSLERTPSAASSAIRSIAYCPGFVVRALRPEPRTLRSEAFTAAPAASKASMRSFVSILESLAEIER